MQKVGSGERGGGEEGRGKLGKSLELKRSGGDAFAKIRVQIFGRSFVLGHGSFVNVLIERDLNLQAHQMTKDK